MYETIGHVLHGLKGWQHAYFFASPRDISGPFDPGEHLAPPTGPEWRESHSRRYGVDHFDTTGYPVHDAYSDEAIRYLVAHPSNPLQLTEAARARMLAVDSAELRMGSETYLDLCVVGDGSLPAYALLEREARALGYGSPLTTLDPESVTATSALPPLSPIEQRAEELGIQAEGAWIPPCHQWLAPATVRALVTAIALVGLPIWRRAAERIAQRAAELIAQRTQ